MGVTEIMSKPQVNLLLSRAEYDLVQTLAFIDQCAVSEVLRPAVESFLRRQSEDPEVQLALQALQARRAKKEGRLTNLRQKASDNDSA